MGRKKDAHIWQIINGLEDADMWPETAIDFYASVMHSLLSYVKGLGVLILTWTTAVLLGGFVGQLRKVDFWCLTGIILVQLVGAFNIFFGFRDSSSESISREMCRPFKELYHDDDIPPACKLILFIFLGILMVFLITIGVALSVIALIILSLIAFPIIVILVPSIAIDIFGVLISTAVSVFRLLENDYGNAVDAKSKPALILLYSLVVLQGVVFGSMGFYSCARRKKIVSQVQAAYKISQSNLLVSNYLRETVVGCEKGRAFFKGRNLVTYAVDQLMKPVRPERYISGLSCIISASLGTGRQVRLKELLIESSTYSQLIHKLLGILHPKSHYSRETRKNAACIVAFLADEIHLEEFPHGILCISWLLDTLEEYPWLVEACMVDRKQQELPDDFHEKKELPDDRVVWLWLHDIKKPDNIYKRCEGHEATETLDNQLDLVLQGLRILAGLADSEENCRVIGNTAYLLSRIKTHLVSIRLHQEDHEKWSSTGITQESLVLMCKLMAAPGETADRLRCHISSDGNTIVSALQIILQCTQCEGKTVQLLAMEILLDLSSVDTAGSIIMAMSGASDSRPFIVKLLRVYLQIYTSDETKLLQKMCTSKHWMKKRSDMSNLAGNMLASLSSQSERITTAILEVCISSSVLGDLVNTFVNPRDNAYRMRAAEMLEHLCIRYTEDDEDFKELKKALLDAMPKVLTELLGYGNVTSYSAQGSDLEEGRALHDNSRRNKYSFCWQNGEQQGNNGAPKETLLSFFVMIGKKFISNDPVQAGRFDEITSEICSELGKPIKTFNSLMEEAQEILTKDKAKQFAILFKRRLTTTSGF